jgi:DNA-binding transcriptional LysR family regulator
MDERDWDILKAIVQEHSAVKAAERLFMTQPAVTYRMSRIETEMGCKIFIRNRKGASLTSAGERLLTFADLAQRQYTDIRDYVRNQGDALSGVIRFGATSAFAEIHLPAILREFRRFYPQVCFNLKVGTSNEVMKSIYYNEVLAAVVRGDHQWNEKTVHLYDDPLKLVTPNPIKSTEELKQIPYIGFSGDPALQYQINKWLGENFLVPPAPTIQTDSIHNCLNLVSEGLGWTIASFIRLSAYNDHIFHSTIYDNLGNPYLRPSYLLYTKSALEYDTYKTFIKYFQEAVIKGFSGGKAEDC